MSLSPRFHHVLIRSYEFKCHVYLECSDIETGHPNPSLSELPWPKKMSIVTGVIKTLIPIILVVIVIFVWILWSKLTGAEYHTIGLDASKCQQSHLYKALVVKFKNEPITRNKDSLLAFIREINPSVEKTCGVGFIFENNDFHVATGETLSAQFGDEFLALCVNKKSRLFEDNKFYDRYYLFKKNGNKIGQACAP